MDTPAIAVLYLDRNRFDFHGGTAVGIVTCVFPQEVVSDIEVVNRQAFRTHIQSFLAVNKITPTKILIVLSSKICFEKLISPSQIEADEEVKRFVDLVPFEDVISRTYKTQKGTLAVATNSQYIDALKVELASFGHSILTVVPASMLGIPISGLDVKTAESISAIALSLVTLDITHSPPMTLQAKQESQRASFSRNRRAIVLLFIFLILILILIVLLKTTVFT